jgi:glutamate N-acetyltransferase/amino-acid N-acetyltransferase
MSVKVPQGFKVAGVHCGIKKIADKEDLTLVVAERPAVAAGVYTQNLVYAAPVAFDRQRTPSSNIRVVVANSGNANACTGERGMQDAQEMARLAAEACGVDPQQTLVMSTGVIGEFLPIDKIAAGVTAAAQKLGTDEQSLLTAARGIMTTDKVHKLSGRSVTIGGREIQITGMAKGAGMIGPKMATMLSVLMTDAVLTPADAQQALSTVVDNSFNCISVEGHTSTNDTVLLLAGGAAGGQPLADKDLHLFRATLEELCIELARMIPNDGEGASHLINIEVRGCATRDDAQRIAKTVANSALVKTAVAGADPNWGRIVSAAGYSGVLFNPAGVDLRINGTLLYKRGSPVHFDAAEVSQSIRGQRETFIALQLDEGDAGVRFWTSDLTVEYIKINADYHT